MLRFKSEHLEYGNFLLTVGDQNYESYVSNYLFTNWKSEYKRLCAVADNWSMNGHWPFFKLLIYWCVIIQIYQWENLLSGKRMSLRTQRWTCCGLNTHLLIKHTSSSFNGQGKIIIQTFVSANFILCNKQ